MNKPEDRPAIYDVKRTGQQDVQWEIAKARRYFAKAEVTEALKLQAQKTLDWMRDNKQSYEASGSLKQSEPWWPAPPETGSKVLQLCRQRVLQDRAYEHGMLHYLRGLEHDGIIDRLNDRVIDMVVSAMTPVVLGQLVIRRHSPHLLDSSTLAELSQLFGNGKGTKPTKIRDKYLGDLAALGLVNGRENQGYAISVGPVADIFYTDVLTVIIEYMDVRYAANKQMAA